MLGFQIIAKTLYYSENYRNSNKRRRWSRTC